MSFHACDIINVPEETARVARAAFPKGNVYMTMVIQRSRRVG